MAGLQLLEHINCCLLGQLLVSRQSRSLKSRPSAVGCGHLSRHPNHKTKCLCLPGYLLVVPGWLPLHLLFKDMLWCVQSQISVFILLGLYLASCVFRSVFHQNVELYVHCFLGYLFSCLLLLIAILPESLTRNVYTVGFLVQVFCSFFSSLFLWFYNWIASIICHYFVKLFKSAIETF